MFADRGILCAGTVYLLIFCMGCSSIVVEEDGVPVGGREGLVVVNPAGHILNDLKSQVEITYEKTLNKKDSSLITLGYGADDRDGNDSTGLYLLAGGRWYPAGTAPHGFFIHGDIGVGHFTYELTDSKEVTFIYGVFSGYKMIFSGFVLDMGAGYIKMDFKENDPEFLPILRLQLGMQF